MYIGTLYRLHLCQRFILSLNRLDTEAAVSGDAESVVMVKLTDEMIAAIQRAQRLRTRMRISIHPQVRRPFPALFSQMTCHALQNGVISLGELGDSGQQQFRFAVQSLSGQPSDVVAYDKKHGYRAVAAVHNKYQVGVVWPALW